MRTDKGKAFVLRREGKSYRDISAELGVAKSTLSNWFAGVDFSAAIKNELTKEATKKSRKHLQHLNQTRGIALDVQYELAEKEALKEMKLYRNIPLFSTALSLYWAEGDQVGKNQVRLRNSDAKILLIFITFLQKLCGVDKADIKLALFIYPDLAENKCKRYWSKELGIKTFHKTQVLPKRNRTDRLPYGVCMLVVSNSILQRKLQVWIDHLPEIVLNTVPQTRKKK